MKKRFNFTTLPIFLNICLLANCLSALKLEKKFGISVPFIKAPKLTTKIPPGFYKGFAIFKLQKKNIVKFKIILKDSSIGDITGSRFELMEGTLALESSQEIKNPISLRYTSNSGEMKTSMDLKVNFEMKDQRKGSFELSKLIQGFVMKSRLPSPSQDAEFHFEVSKLNLLDLDSQSILEMNGLQFFLLPVTALSLYLILSGKKNKKIPALTLFTFSVLCFSLNYVTIYTCSDIMGKSESCHMTHLWGLIGIFSLIIVLVNFKRILNRIISVLIFFLFFGGIILCFFTNFDDLPWCLFLSFVSLLLDILDGKDKDMCFFTLLMLLCQIGTYFYVYSYEFNSSLIPNNSEIDVNYLWTGMCLLVGVFCLAAMILKNDKDDKVGVAKSGRNCEKEEGLLSEIFTGKFDF